MVALLEVLLEAEVFARDASGARMRIRHHGRTRLRSFLRTQRKLGAGFTAARLERPELAGARLVRWRPLLLLLPLVRMGTRARYARQAGKLGRFVLASPLVFLGLCAHAWGALRAPRRS